MVLGIDTSNYTTSVAYFEETSGKNCSRLLDVKPGELGLRQSDALFSHVKRLPELMASLAASLPAESTLAEISAIGVSTRPRAVEGSYMPCFLAGESLARCLGEILKVPVYSFSHQQGHIAASLWSAGRLDLMHTPHLAWHLSGGTTELLLVKPDANNVSAERIGGTTDISAGQLIDRTGNLLGLGFPAGKAVDAMSLRSIKNDTFRVKVHDCQFSLSGMENKVRALVEQGEDGCNVARFALSCIAGAVGAATAQALENYPGYQVVFSGGVASNTLLRQRFEGPQFLFSPPEYATDNAMGIAVLTWIQEGLS